MSEPETQPSIGFDFDAISYWSELKLEIVEKYGRAYTKAFTNHPGIKKYYIDGFSGAGTHARKTTGELVDGSPIRALRIEPPFDGFHFIDLNEHKTVHLRQRCEGMAKVQIHTGDCSETLRRDVLPQIRYGDYKRALCLLDPYGMHLDWDVIEMAGKSGAIDLFLNFPVMDINRNAIWRNAKRTAPKWGTDRFDRLWGDNSWREVVYLDTGQSNLFDPEPELRKLSNEGVVGAFVKRLKETAGFKFVADPLPMKNSTNAVVYYLIGACVNRTGAKIIREVLDKYR